MYHPDFFQLFFASCQVKSEWFIKDVRELVKQHDELNTSFND